MTKTNLLGAVTLLLLAVPAQASPGSDAAATVATVLDKFNAGDVGAFVAAHTADAVIVDEFAPYLWTGGQSAERWVNDYAKDAEARGISGGRIDHGRPVQSAGTDLHAYVVVPTTYCFDQGGKPMAADGMMTFAMAKLATEWKIAGWTYSAPTPAPAAKAIQGKCGKAKLSR